MRSDWNFWINIFITFQHLFSYIWCWIRPLYIGCQHIPGCTHTTYCTLTLKHLQLCPISLNMHVIVCGTDLEHMKETHADMLRKCKFHTERPSVWPEAKVLSTEHCASFIITADHFPFASLSICAVCASACLCMCVSGVGGNLVAVQASRISTYLHMNGLPMGDPNPTPRKCPTPCTSFFSSCE